MKFKQKRKNAFIVCTIACFFVTAVLLFINFWVIDFFDSPTSETDTIEFNGTFDRVEKDKNDYLIYVNEYPWRLLLPVECVIDVEYLLKLVRGETIYFRIYNASQNLLNSSTITQLAIVTFKTQERDIATLQSHNKFEKSQRTKGKITASVFASIFALCGIYCIIKCNRVKL